MNTRPVRPVLAILALISFCGAAPAFAQFTNIGSVPLASVRGGSAAWGDYDGDGDLDVLVSGVLRDPPHTQLAKIFRNNGETFPTYTDIGAVFLNGAVAWADEDRDGDLDVLISGAAGYRLRTYRSSGGPTPTFVVGSEIAGDGGRVAWGDGDGDGDLDAFSTSPVGFSPIPPAILYWNLGATPPFWEDSGAQLPGAALGHASWGDYDGDQDLDLFYSGYINQPGNSDSAWVFRNQGGVLTDAGIHILSATFSYSTWGDYDNDGDLDLVVLGDNDPIGPMTRLYRNTGGPDPDLVYSGVPLLSLREGSAAWGDFDNDGDRDLLLSGQNPFAPSGAYFRAALYRNNGGPDPTFTFTGVHFDSMAGNASFGDHDNDGDLDVLIAGWPPGLGSTTRVYRNGFGYPANLPPATPAGLHATAAPGGSVTFAWDASTDDTTPAAGLTYQLRVGTTPGGSEVLAPSANPSGKLRVPADGNCGSHLSWTMNLLRGTYYWSVQSIDAGYAGSPFATEVFVEQTTAVEGPSLEGFALGVAIPTPARTAMVVPFSLPREAAVRMEVFDLSGRRIATLADAKYGAGRHEARWDVTASQVPVASGVYLVRLTAGAFIAARRIVVSR